MALSEGSDFKMGGNFHRGCLASVFIFLIFLFSGLSADAQGLHGYVSYSTAEPPDSYNVGMGFYSAVWPLIKNPVRGIQIGLPGAWIIPDNSDNKSKPLCPVGTYARDNWPERGPTWGSVFQTLEGGLGYWAGNRFRYGPPKFSMNATAQCYDYEIASPGWSFFRSSSALPDDKLGVAQLSNRILIPPDGLTFQGNPNGSFLGYSWMALPLTEAVSGKQPTGEKSWTCFLNALNFKGPIAYYIPETWSKVARIFDYEFDYGRGLDSRVGRMGGGAMEFNSSPHFEAKDSQGQLYSKIPELQFPVDEDGKTILVQDVMYYSKDALYNAVKSWRDGGRSCDGKFKKSGLWKAKLSTDTPRFDQADKQLSGIDKIFDTEVFDSYFWGLKWYDGSAGCNGYFPQYFKQVGDKRVAVSKSEVPEETKLLDKEFRRAKVGSAYTSPSGGGWGNPGPVKGPFRVTLADGSVVTYCWYRFIDQPSFQQFKWSDEKKAKLQSLVEKIHSRWMIDREYMPPPSTGDEILVKLDSALIVTPPSGLEAGYVPIVTGQKQAAIGQNN